MVSICFFFVGHVRPNEVAFGFQTVPNVETLRMAWWLPSRQRTIPHSRGLRTVCVSRRGRENLAWKPIEKRWGKWWFKCFGTSVLSLEGDLLLPGLTFFLFSLKGMMIPIQQVYFEDGAKQPTKSFAIERISVGKCSLLMFISVQALKRGNGRQSFRKKLHFLLETGQMHEYRFLLNLHHYYLQGFVGVVPIESLVPAFDTDIDPCNDAPGFILARFLHDNHCKRDAWISATFFQRKIPMGFCTFLGSVEVFDWDVEVAKMLIGTACLEMRYGMPYVPNCGTMKIGQWWLTMGFHGFSIRSQWTPDTSIFISWNGKTHHSE